MILSVILEVKLRRMNWKKQRDQNRWSQRAPQRSLLNQRVRVPGVEGRG